MVYTDSHAHLSSVAEELGREAFASLLDSYAEAWVEAVGAGRQGPLILDPGTEPEDLDTRLELLGGGGPLPPFLCVAAGIWPSAESLADPEASLALLASAISRADGRGARVAAIGEGGLDYHHMEGSKEAQARLFEGQLTLAKGLGLPMIVHSREAADDTLGLIRDARSAHPVVIHCFGYGAEEARAFLELGCYISFAGNLTYKKSEPLREACALVPADRILLETDAPYMNPMPLRGKSSSPVDIERTYALAADLRGVTIAFLAETVSLNAHTLFG
jgi:TatD DNase family protein